MAADDLFISDEEVEYCPLCVEEMDISDKNFKPCPCGYQICQFCYNNIRQNPELNGRCPGCRRLYDDESVEYKSISAEEYRLQQIKKEKREKEKKQKEKEKKETELANKKHLAGLRVVQKNLVYVTGLNPPCPQEDLHSVLRSDKYFGQYGKISKIVINRKTPPAGQHHLSPGLVVYVTFSRKEDALKCINELDGSLCDGRVLRAAHGTTKYCSSYLRGHPCPNPNCMFLHEPGEEADSYTRKDLSTHQGIKMGMLGLGRLSDDEHMVSDDDHRNATSSSTPVVAANQLHTTTTNLLTTPGPILPATASWAKAGNSTSASPSASPSVNNNIALTNAAAFPTLSEIFKDKHQKKDVKQKLKPKAKESAVLLPDDIDIDDDSAIQFAEETADYLKGLAEKKEQLKVHFKPVGAEVPRLPLFVFDPSASYSTNTKLEDEKVIARQVIERFLLRPIKNYHLSYQNHPIAQQQALLQQKAQLHQQQQHQQFQTPTLQQLPLDKKQLDPSEQQQQLLLLQQLQQQQVPQVNNVLFNERASTATPPPPGLFTGNKPQPNGQYNQKFPPATQSSSSQLLTQLMSGKR